MTAAASIPDLLSPEFAVDPYSAYREMRREAPLIWHEPTRSYVISRYEDVERAFKDEVFTTANYDWQIEPVHGRTFLQMSGREHSLRRALVAPAFRGSELREKFLPVIERNSRDLIEAFPEDGTLDLVDRFATRFPINVIVDMLGLNRSDHDRFHRWYTAIVAFATNLSGDPEVAAGGLRARAELAEYMIPVIRERRANLGGDLLSTLCTAEIDGTAMSDEDIKSFVSLLLAAGGETTDKGIASVFSNLLTHPEQLRAVREDRSLIALAFAETLRYTPPVHMIMRQVADDVTLSGGEIPKGSTVICLIGAANRDENRYEDPDTFNIFRSELKATTAFTAAAAHLAFALGRHFCVGALLAKTEVEVAVNQLLDSLPDLRFADGFTPAERGVFTRAPATLMVSFRSPRRLAVA